jgi:hypothetical protein
VVGQTDQLLGFQAAVSKDLANVLDYNPTLDFRQFSPGDEDTMVRFDRAKGAVGMYDDPSTKEVVQSIELLQNELEHFSQTDDLPRWKKVFAAEQVAIQLNRDKF